MSGLDQNSLAVEPTTLGTTSRNLNAPKPKGPTFDRPEGAPRIGGVLSGRVGSDRDPGPGGPSENGGCRGGSGRVSAPPEKGPTVGHS